MQMLAEAIYELEPGQMLAGQTPTARALLKLWVYRHNTGFNLYATSIAEAGEAPAQNARNAVGRDLVSCAEVLEALYCLEEAYRVSPHLLRNLAVEVRKATPELQQLLEEQLSRAARSVLTGKFSPDDPPAQILQLKPVCVLEEQEADEDFAGLVLTDP